MPEIIRCLDEAGRPVNILRHGETIPTRSMKGRGQAEGMGEYTLEDGLSVGQKDEEGALFEDLYGRRYTRI
jgi:hypothetical protein